jgi:hypothetical protein
MVHNLKPRTTVQGNLSNQKSNSNSNSKRHEAHKQSLAPPSNDQQDGHPRKDGQVAKDSASLANNALTSPQERIKPQIFKGNQAQQLLKTHDAFFKRRAIMQNASLQSRKIKQLESNPNASLFTNIYTPVLKNLNTEHAKNRKQNAALKTTPQKNANFLPAALEEAEPKTEPITRESKKSKLTEIQEIYSHHNSSTATIRQRSSQLQLLQSQLIREPKRRR